MTPRTSSRLALAIFFGTLVLCALAVQGLVSTQDVQNENVWGIRGSGPVAAAVFAACGALLGVKRPENAIGWLFSATGVTFAVLTLTDTYGVLSVARGETGGIRYQLAWFSSWGWIIFLACISFAILLFPSGHLPGPRWRRRARLMAVGFVLAGLSFGLTPGPLNNAPSHVTNRYALPDTPLVEAFLVFGMLVFMAANATAIIGVVQQFRASRGLQRQQMKLFVFTAAGLPLSLGMLIVAEFVYPAAMEALEIIASLAIAGVPIAMAVAILRYRLYDIDVIINRTLVYGMLTAVLGATYLGSVVFFHEVLGVFSIDSNFGVAASTLAVAALFRPVRERVQSFIDHRFYRSRYDAAATLESFASRLRDQVDLESLKGELLAAVGSTMQPAHVSLWLRDRELASGEGR